MHRLETLKFVEAEMADHVEPCELIASYLFCYWYIPSQIMSIQLYVLKLVLIFVQGHMVHLTMAGWF